MASMFERGLTRRGFVGALAGTFGATLLVGCSKDKDEEVAEEFPEDLSGDLEYLALVNKQHKVADAWRDTFTFVSYTNSEGDTVELETKANDAFVSLKSDLEADGVNIDLGSAFVSVDDQQKLVEELTEEQGAAYVKHYVTAPGFSEYHTGLALDLYPIIAGEAVTDKADMATHPKVWEKVHAKLADHGFILRCPAGKKIMTGYSYEPWHIRYVDSADVAHEIMDGGLTLEEYLDQVDPIVAGCVVDYGTSELFTEADMDAALDAILEQFCMWKGCVMKRIAFTDDKTCTDDLKYVNGLRAEDTKEFDQAIVFMSDFHSPVGEDAEDSVWDEDTDYNDFSWHLGRTGADGIWRLLTWGYA